MSLTNDALSKARTVARAQSQEDFEFFANTVCGLHVPEDVCALVQHSVLHGEGVSHINFPHALHELCALSWMGIVGKGPITPFPSETFSWIFYELEAA